MGGYRQLPITEFNPQQSNPLQMLAQVNQLKTAQLQQQGLAQENQQRQIGLQDQQAMSAAMHEWDGKDINGLVPLMVKHGASANAVIGLKGKVLEQQEKYSKIAADDATTGSKNLETQKGKNDQILGGINSLKDVPDEQLAQAIPGVIQSLTQQGALAPQEAQQASQIAQSGDPVAIRKQLDIFAKLHSTASQQMEQAAKQAEAFKNQQEGRKAQFEANNLGNFGPSGPAAEAKYRSILGKLSAGQDVPDADIQFAKGMELSNTKTTTQSDTLGVTSTNTSKPSGLAAARARFNAARGVATPAAGGGGSQPAAASAKDSIVDMVGQYKMNPTMLQRMVVKHPDVIAAVNQKYPDWNQPQYNAINKAITDLAPSGKTGQQITSYNTFLRHAGALYDAVDSLDNSKSSDLLNKPLNWLAQHTGDPRVADFMAAMQPPMKEFQSFLLNNHAMHVEDVKDAHSLIDENKTPQEIRAVLKRFAETGSARLSEQNESFKRVTGKDIPDLVSPAAAAAYNKITGGQSGGGNQQHLAGSKASLPEGSTGTGSDGNKYVVKGGVWAPK